MLYRTIILFMLLLSMNVNCQYNINKKFHDYAFIETEMNEKLRCFLDSVGVDYKMVPDNYAYYNHINFNFDKNKFKTNVNVTFCLDIQVSNFSNDDYLISGDIYQVVSFKNYSPYFRIKFFKLIIDRPSWIQKVNYDKEYIIVTNDIDEVIYWIWCDDP